jgi:hypothetical protein
MTPTLHPCYKLCVPWRDVTSSAKSYNVTFEQEKKEELFHEAFDEYDGGLIPEE